MSTINGWPNCQDCDLPAIVVGGLDPFYPACWYHGLDSMAFQTDDGKWHDELADDVPWLTMDEV